LIIKGIFHLISVSQVEGISNLPSSGPVIVAANHLTYVDPFTLQFALPRPLFYMGKEQLFRNPALDWVLRQLGGFPVYRGEKDAWAIQHAGKVLRNDQVLGIFPEGTRSWGKGLRPAKTGAARMALAVGCPIVPIALHGPQYMFKHFPRRTTIHITIGDPLYPEADETYLSLTDRLMFTLAGMLPPEARGVYRYRPPGF
jgi:1-acyl-sn-glycerol-3-phosphate acyltransferase